MTSLSTAPRIIAAVVDRGLDFANANEPAAVMPQVRPAGFFALGALLLPAFKGLARHFVWPVTSNVAVGWRALLMEKNGLAWSLFCVAWQGYIF